MPPKTTNPEPPLTPPEIETFRRYLIEESLGNMIGAAEADDIALMIAGQEAEAIILRLLTPPTPPQLAQLNLI